MTAGRVVLLLLLGGSIAAAACSMGDQRQDAPRANDHVLNTIRSADGRLAAYLVMREADSLSADVMKVYVAPAGEPWFNGRKVLEGRRFSRLDAPLWLSGSSLCIPASEDGVEVRQERVAIAGGDVRVRLAPSVEACLAAGPGKGA